MRLFYVNKNNEKRICRATLRDSSGFTSVYNNFLYKYSTQHSHRIKECKPNEVCKDCVYYNVMCKTFKALI